MGVSTLSSNNALTPAWCSRTLPGDSIRSHRLKAWSHKTAPTPHVRSQSQTQVVTSSSNLWAINQRLPWTPSQGSVILLYWLTELWFITKSIKGYKSIARRRDTNGRYRAQSFPDFSGCTMLPRSLGADQPGSSLNPVLLRFHGSFITEAWCWNHWPLVTGSASCPSFMPRSQGVGPKVPTLPSHCWLHWRPDPSFSAFQRPPH